MFKFIVFALLIYVGTVAISLIEGYQSGKICASFPSRSGQRECAFREVEPEKFHHLMKYQWGTLIFSLGVVGGSIGFRRKMSRRRLVATKHGRNEGSKDL